MFTIKHVDSRFNEFVIEAGSFDWNLSDAASSTFPEGEAMFRAYKEPHRDGECVGVWSGKPYDYKTPDTDTIYVMNRHGATVAVYHFLVHANALKQAA